MTQFNNAFETYVLAIINKEATPSGEAALGRAKAEYNKALNDYIQQWLLHEGERDLRTALTRIGALRP